MWHAACSPSSESWPAVSSTQSCALKPKWRLIWHHKITFKPPSSFLWISNFLQTKKSKSPTQRGFNCTLQAYAVRATSRGDGRGQIWLLSARSLESTDSPGGHRAFECHQNQMPAWAESVCSELNSHALNASAQRPKWTGILMTVSADRRDKESTEITDACFKTRRDH